MKLYHYALKGNDVLKKGLLSFANNPDADLSYYFKRTNGKTTHQEIVEWMESCYTGRSRAIRGFSEPIQWSEKNIHCLKDFIDNADLFEIDISAMDKDSLIEAVYMSPPVSNYPELEKKNYSDEVLIKLNDIKDIDYSPVDWNACDDELQHRFAYVRYYLIVVQGGVILPKYLKLVTD